MCHTRGAKVVICIMTSEVFLVFSSLCLLSLQMLLGQAIAAACLIARGLQS